jgi:hypothetical protein
VQGRGEHPEPISHRTDDRKEPTGAGRGVLDVADVGDAREAVDGGQTEIRPLKIRIGVDDDGQIDGIGNGGEISDDAVFAEGKVGLQDNYDAVDAKALEFTGLTEASAVVVAATPAMTGTRPRAASRVTSTTRRRWAQDR